MDGQYLTEAEGSSQTLPGLCSLRLGFEDQGHQQVEWMLFCVLASGILIRWS